MPWVHKVTCHSSSVRRFCESSLIRRDNIPIVLLMIKKSIGCDVKLGEFIITAPAEKSFATYTCKQTNSSHSLNQSLLLECLPTLVSVLSKQLAIAAAAALLSA